MSKLLDTAEILRQLNTLWDEHAKHIDTANKSLNTMLKTASKVPSSYISIMNNVAAAQAAVTSSTNALSVATAKNASQLRLSITASSAMLNKNKDLASAIDSLESKLKKANDELSKYKTNSASASAASGTNSAKIKALTADVERLTTRLNMATTSVTRLGNSSGLSLAPLMSLMGAFGISTGVYLFAQITKNIFNTTRELESLDLAMKMVSETQSQYTKNSEFVNNVSQKWGLEVKSLTQQYIQFYTASKGLLSEDSIKKTFEGIAKAGSIMGLSLEKQSSAFYAIDQMMSKGTVSSEELKKQLGNALPGAIKAAAMAYMDLHPAITSIQKAEEALYKDMKKGAIDSATYVPLIVKNFQILYGIENLDKVETLTSKVNNLGNAWTQLVRDMNGSKNTLGVFFAWFINESTEALKGWSSILESVGSKREKFLAKLRLSSSDLAVSNIAVITGDDNKRDYATSMIESLQEKLGVLKAKTDELVAINASVKTKLRADQKSQSISGLESNRRELSINRTEQRIGKNNDELTKLMGLIDGYRQSLTKLNKVDSDNTGGGSGSNSDRTRRERIKLNFDWLKSEYELKKAIIEKNKLDSSFEMDDDTKTLAYRLDARIEFSKHSMELMDLELKYQKALNIEKYSNDIERNNVALRNKDLTQAEHAQNVSDLNRRLNNEQLKLDEEYSSKWKTLMNENKNFSVKINEKRLEYIKITTKAEFDFYIKEQQEFLKRKNISDTSYTQILNDIRAAEIIQATKNRDEQLRLAGDEAEKKKAIWVQYGIDLQVINQKMNDGLETLKQRRDKREDEQRTMHEEAYGRQPEKGKFITGFLSGAPDSMVKEYETLLKNYQIAVEAGDEQIIAERKRQLDDFKSYAIKMNEYISGFFSDFASESGFKTLLKAMSGDIEGFGESFASTFLAITEIAQEAMAFLNQNSAAYYEAERQRLDDSYAYALEMAGDNEAAKADIDKQYEAKKREIARREAKANQEMAMFNIAINTAQAIVGLWAKPGFPAAIPLAIAVGAIGALQMAVVASKPLPQYFQGTENAKEGNAIVDERGAELHLDRFGKIKDFGSSSGPRIKHLNDGDKIIPAHKTKNIMNGTDFTSLDEILFNNNISYSDESVNLLDVSEIVSGLRSLKSSIDNKETSEEHYDERGYTKYRIKNNVRIEDKNNRIRFKKSIL